MDFLDDCMDSEEQDLSTQFQQTQRNLLIDLQEIFECYCNKLPLFFSNSATTDLTLNKSHLFLIRVNERDIETTVIEKVIQFVSFIFGDTHFLNMIFLGGAKVSIRFSKLSKLKRRKDFSPMNGFFVLRNWATKKFLRLTSSLTFCATVTLSKKFRTVTKTLFKVVYLESKH